MISTMEKENINVTLVLLYIVFVSILFLIGLLLQIKIIKTARQEKPVTWITEIFHSIVMIIHFSLVLFDEVIVYMIPDYIGGGWICILLRFIQRCGVVTITSHSMLISVHKYIVIVNRIRDNSERLKLETFLLVLYLIFSILWSAATFIRDVSSIPIFYSSENCFTLRIWKSENTDGKLDIAQADQSTKFASFCKFGGNHENYNGDNFIYFMTELYCIAQTILYGMIAFNILEALVYYKIFRFIKR